MELPVLPAKYYRSHFFELIEFLEAHSQHLFEEEHISFLRDFRGLSENAQCLYVRMVNRTGCIFDLQSFKKYQEIENLSETIQELRHTGFITPIDDTHRVELVSFFPKTDLRRWLQTANIAVPLSVARDQIAELALAHLDSLRTATAPRSQDLMAQGRTTALDYLLFLYFGKIQKTLTLYTLRDLGIRKAGTLKTEFRARFQNLSDAKTEYFLLHLADRALEMDDVVGSEILESLAKTGPLRESSQAIRDQILLEIATRAQDEELAFRALELCESHPARERQIRLLFSTEKVEESKKLLEAILQDPWSDEELLFAEDFLARKFQKKRAGYLSEALKTSREVVVSDMFLKKPEHGVRIFFEKQGFKTHFTENYLWNGIFGLLFWNELFENEATALFNPFERSPKDLVGSQFYETHKNAIEQKLLLFQEPSAIRKYLVQMATQHYGQLNDIFQWHPSLLPTTLEFLVFAKGKNLAHIFRMMARRYATYHSGYPDLMVFREDGPHFIEVKAEGDAVRPHQLSKMRLLKEAGFEVEILRVRWQADPNQIYTVIDIETTGGSPKFHRITEVAAVKMQGGQIIDEFQSLINPGRPIPRNITELTGITNAMVADAPAFSEIAMRLLEFTKDTIFVAHFVRFDYGFIQNEFQRLELSFVRPLLCTCAGMKKAYPGLPSYSLKNLTEHFHISMRQHHRAMSDARAAGQLLNLMNSKRTLSEEIPLSEHRFSSHPREH